MRPGPRAARAALALLGALAVGAGCAAMPRVPDRPYEGLGHRRAAVNRGARRAVLPLRRAEVNGRPVWYVITESSDSLDARRLDVSWAPRLRNALRSGAVRRVLRPGPVERWSGDVDFSPERRLAPGPEGFPPAEAAPGSVGDSLYSPLVAVGNGVVRNAPIVANATGVHDRVIAIDYEKRLVALALTEGFYDARPVLYVSLEASDATAAAIERATYAPRLALAPGLASDDDDSARSAIIQFVDGRTGAADPERQGLPSFLLGEGDALAVTQSAPGFPETAAQYSPVWDLHLARWSDAAHRAGLRRRVEDHGAVATLAQQGALASAGLGPANPYLGGLRATGVVVNCPIVWVEGR